MARTGGSLGSRSLGAYLGREWPNANATSGNRYPRVPAGSPDLAKEGDMMSEGSSGKTEMKAKRTFLKVGT